MKDTGAKCATIGLDMLRPKESRPLGSLASKCLAKNKQAILAKWETRVRKELPAAGGKGHFVLLDSLPQFIDEMCNSLSVHFPTLVKAKEVGEGHALQRSAISDYDLNQVLAEYRVLRQVIFETLEENCSLTSRERDTILDIIHNSSTAAAKRYAEVAVERESRVASALKDAEETLSLALQSAKMGVFSINLQTGAIHWSDQLQVLYGYKPGDFPGTAEGIFSRVHSEDLFRVKQMFEHIPAQQGPFELEYRVLWPDGSIHWISSQGQVQFDSLGNPVRLAGVAHESTDRKEAEAKLRRSEERFQLAGRATRQAIWDWDLRNNKLEWNEAFHTVFGHPKELLRAEVDVWLERIHPQDRTRVKGGILKAIRQGDEYWQDQYRFIHGNGTYRRMIDRGFILRDQAGVGTRMIGAMEDITEVYSAQEALEKERALLHAVINQMPAAVWIGEAPSGKVRMTNTRALTIMDQPVKPAETIADYPRYRIFHPDGRPYAVEDYPTAKALASGEVIDSQEMIARRKDGSSASLQTSAAPICDSNGRIVNTVTVAIDVTELRRAQEELRKSEERYRTLFENAPVGIVEVNPESRKIMRANPMFCEMLGYSEEELQSRTVPEITHPEDIDPDQTDANAALNGPRNQFRKEKRYLRKDGSSMWAETAVNAARIPTSGPPFFIAVVSDISERKKTEQALEETREWLSLALSAAKIGIFEDNLDTGEVTWTREEALIFGFPPDQLKVTLNDIFNVLHPDDAPIVDAALRSSVESGKDFRAEFRIRWPEGGIRWLIGLGRVIRGRKGAKLRLLGINIDITERKRHEEELFRAIRAREEVLAIVSHDLRNPLGAIMMSANLLERSHDRKLPEDFVKKQDQKILTSGHRMNRLVEDLLDLSKMDARRFVLNRKVGCSADLIEEVAELMRPYAKEKSIQFEVDYGEKPFQLLCDHDHLVRVFTNLLGNAIKFTADYGTVRLKTSVESDHVRFAIVDTGPGIAEHHLPHIFERFWQVSKTAHKGTGLGLTIAKGIVEAHGGSLWVESKFGKGTTFFFTIPRVH
jgi:PAS domain S-box-containing protein